MGVNLKGRSFLTLMDFSPLEIRYLLDLAHDLKAKKRAGIRTNTLAGKNIVLLFEKTSTRTRCSFEVAARDEGAGVTFLDSKSSQMGKKESIADTAKVLGRFFDGIEYRGYEQSVVEELAENAGVPVWNGLTDVDHPTQILADFLTIQEKCGGLTGRKLAFLGDGRNNMANSLLIGCAKMGVDFTIVSPECLRPEESLVEDCRAYAAESGAAIEFSEDLDAVYGADVIYTDVWASMGEEAAAAEREALLSPYQVNAELMRRTGKDETIFLHCLPAIKGKEVTEEVFEGPHSFVFDEAENRPLCTC